MIRNKISAKMTETKRKAFISYIDDNNKVVFGFFEIIEQTNNYLKIKSGSNILTIPYHKINKVKERLKGGGD